MRKKISANGTKRLKEAYEVLTDLGFPEKDAKRKRTQRVLLSFADLEPKKPWIDAAQRTLGVHEVLEYINKADMGEVYAADSRESIRDDIQLFMEAGILEKNPNTNLPPNSGATCYALIPEVVKLLKEKGAAKKYYTLELQRVLGRMEHIKGKNQLRKHIDSETVVLPQNGKTFSLSKGGQGPIIRGIIEQFLPIRGKTEVIYVHDGEDIFFDNYCSDKKLATSIKKVIESAAQSNVAIRRPDVIARSTEKKWLFIFEACHSDGVVSKNRREELKHIFGGFGYGIIYVSCFSSMAELAKKMTEIAWETEAWALEYPEHLVHMDGNRFLGPYD